MEAPKSARNFRVIPLVLVACCGVWPVAGVAQDSLTPRVDEYVNAQMGRGGIVGLAVAVFTNGQTVLAKGYGLANVEHHVPVKPETIFQSGSMGKQFTATGIMMLVEEGKLSLDDRITKYFNPAPDSWTNIAVRHLLTHTGGLGDYPKDFDLQKDYTEDQLLQQIQAIPLEFQPGEKWRYSNLGYVTLGILIHKVTGQFYGDFLRQRIWEPLGMRTARIISEQDIITNRAAGYVRVDNQLKNQSWVSPSLNTTADGSLYLSLYDMAKWDAALYTEKLLKKGSLEQMWTPVKLKNGETNNYGFGWGFGEAGGHRIIEHGGAWQGFTAHISRYVDDQLTVVVFANLAGVNSSKIAHSIAGFCHPDLVPPVLKAIEDKEPEITTLTKELWAKVAANTLEADRFTPELKARIKESPDVSEYLKSLGPITAIQLVERKQIGDVREYRHRLTFGADTFISVIAFNAEGKISAFGLEPE
ncbi:MAG: serine hydrolase domain-containing protein [Verrucomicrobiia bacterium]